MRIGLALLGLVAAGCVAEPSMNNLDAARSLADAESAFAAQSVRDGMRAAFLAHFAPDGVFVRDGWTVAADWLGPRPDPPIVLDWRPVYVVTSASGDFGLSTGPWKLTSRSDTRGAPAFGQFVSIWKREGRGPWKVAVDLGIGHPEPALWQEALRAQAVPPGKAWNGVREAEARFAREARAHGAREAYRAVASPELRLYRNGSAPAIGAAAASGLAASEDWSWIVEHTETARSGDLAYARGRYESRSPQPAIAGHFLRVWRADGKEWRLVLDVLNPVAAK